MIVGVLGHRRVATSGSRLGISSRRQAAARITIATTALALAVSVACALLLGWLAEGEAQQRRGMELHHLASQAAIRLEGDIERRTSQLTDLVGSGAMESLADTQRIRALVDRLKESWSGYAWIGVADTAGRVVSASGGLLEGVDVSVRPWFQRGRAGLFLGDVHEAALLANRLRGPEGEPLRFVDIALPLLDARGQVTSVLGAHIYWNWATQVASAVVSPTRQASGLELLIASKDGQVLLGPRGLQGTLLRASLTDGTAGAAQFGGALHGGASAQDWPDGQVYLSTAVEFPMEGSLRDLGWMMLARQPLTRSVPIAWDVFRMAFAIGACLSIAAGAATWLLVRRAVADRNVQGRGTLKPVLTIVGSSSQQGRSGRRRRG
ncbi:cache domain-containing protein [Muricoccus aerilatus]|uniref:cache domain-containing protein n=1 Tax=Muricoccus aerilatus TaxID=452982 RepID=UPI0012EB691D|nr:cache domain-containing protein [Roseomonas aerilata]